MAKSDLIAFIILTFSILIFSTIVSEILNTLKPQNKTLLNVKTILKSWWLIISVLMLAMLIGKFGLLTLFFFISILVLDEYLKKSRYGSEHRRLLFGVLSFILLLQYVAIVLHLDQIFFMLVPLAALLVIPTVIIFTKSIANLPTAFAAIFGLMLLNFYLSFIPAIAFSDKINWTSPDQPMVSILILIFFTECNDIFQFLSGKLFGRHKIVPFVSPNKTEMGFIGGLFCTTLTMSFVAAYVLQITRPEAALMGFAVSVFGILGDLFFSATKRNLDIKDFSEVLPGHGGLIDRLDSLVFTAPIYFHLLVYFKGVTR